jgi:hypothetical protein
MGKSFKCKIGLHKWDRGSSHFNFSSNVKDMEKSCISCGKIKRWNKALSRDHDEWEPNGDFDE